jgi:predicted Zn-dependent protease with MMP-like domain
MTYRVSPEEFDGIVLNALELLAPEFYERLQSENVDIVVEPEPSASKLDELGLESDETLFGLSEGVSLADGGSHASTLPSKITIFQRPIEESVDNREDLNEEVLKTVWHEVGHFLGFDEDEVADMGLG